MIGPLIGLTSNLAITELRDLKLLIMIFFSETLMKKNKSIVPLYLMHDFYSITNRLKYFATHSKYK